MKQPPDALEALVESVFRRREAGACERGRELAAWAAGELGPDEAAAFLAHLDGCEACAEDARPYESIRPVWEGAQRRRFTVLGAAGVAAAAAFAWLGLQDGVVAFDAEVPAGLHELTPIRPPPAPAPKRPSPDELPPGTEPFELFLPESRWLAPGEQVDLVRVEGERASTLLADVKVVGRRPAQPGARARTALAVTPDQAHQLTQAVASGTLRATVRNPDDREAPAEHDVTHASLLDLMIRDQEARRRFEVFSWPPRGTTAMPRLVGVPAGARRVAVHIATGTSKIRPGDLVDVMATLPADPAEAARLEQGLGGRLEGPLVATVLEALPVLGVHPDEGDPGATLQVLTTPLEAQLLLLAEESGRLGVLLRNENDRGQDAGWRYSTLQSILTGERYDLLLFWHLGIVWTPKGYRPASGGPRPIAFDPGRECGAGHGTGGFVAAEQAPVSRIAPVVDTPSVGYLKRKLDREERPPPEGVRAEGLLNYFDWRYPAPKTGPFAVHVDGAPSPYDPGRWLMRVGVQGRRLRPAAREPVHLVVLVDVSGSMDAPDRLPLAREALRGLVDDLGEQDTIALVTFADEPKTLLTPTPAASKAELHEAIDHLAPGIPSALATGLELAHDLALTSKPGQVSRIVFLTDGWARFGHHELATYHALQAEGAVTLNAIDFGAGAPPRAASRRGEHRRAQTLIEARRALRAQLGEPLEVIAEDLELEVEFDTVQVRRYRLVGYENGEDGAPAVPRGGIATGHRLTALYELELNGPAPGDGLATIRLGWKAPGTGAPSQARFPVGAGHFSADLPAAGEDLSFAAGLMGAADLLRGEAHGSEDTIEALLCRAGQAAEREEFCALFQRARRILTP